MNQDELKAAVEQSIARYTEKSGNAAADANAPTHHEDGADSIDAADTMEDTDYIERMKEYIAVHYSQDISLTTSSERFFINFYYLSQQFKKKTRYTYMHFLINVRMTVKFEG